MGETIFYEIAAITARDDQEGRILAEGGVDLVLYPFDGAARVVPDLAEAASY